MAETVESIPVRDEARSGGRAAVWLERAVIFWLFALALSAPHSIAATQIAWTGALLCWAARFLARPRPRLERTPVDYALLGFFILTFISSLFSYDQNISIGKLRGASLFTIAYLVAENVRSKRVLRGLALTLVASCMISVFYTFGERAVGRGIKVEGVAANSPLRSAVFVGEDRRETPTPIQSGDTLLEVDGKRLHSPEELAAALEKTNGSDKDFALIKIYRVEWMPVVRVARGQLLDGATALERLGVASAGRGRDWRAAGFYGQYVTYAEALQLIASLALGLFIALRKKWSWRGALLAVALAGMCGALLLTVTRASWLALLLSAAVIALVGMSRRAVIITAGLALPLVLAGLFVLQRQRQVGFYDQNDQSITWRETVWREGFQLLVSQPRHLLVGVGMDSITNKRLRDQWGLFDNGRLPVGHMHSTPLQFALERGVPTLLVWILLVAIYAGMLWRLARGGLVDGWVERGIVLGALGGLTGFVASGMVHYNFGDSEVVMIFYFIMGLSLVVDREARKERRTEL
ncbi:MAG TPA: O-antigen ligase family protein [Pyrinomonadaceae bacterium]|nr:O-antigen ligase family protein [Pyrinomonadaceae bacterium]